MYIIRFRLSALQKISLPWKILRRFGKLPCVAAVSYTHLVMLFARFLPIIGTLAIAGSLAGKKKIATSAGTLSTTNGMFVFLLILIVLIIGALSFFPALALGPLAEFFSNVI